MCDFSPSCPEGSIFCMCLNCRCCTCLAVSSAHSSERAAGAGLLPAALSSDGCPTAAQACLARSAVCLPTALLTQDKAHVCQWQGRTGQRNKQDAWVTPLKCSAIYNTSPWMLTPCKLKVPFIFFPPRPSPLAFHLHGNTRGLFRHLNATETFDFLSKQLLLGSLSWNFIWHFMHCYT